MDKENKIDLNPKILLPGTGVTLILLLGAILKLIISSIVSSAGGYTTKIHSCADMGTGDVRTVVARDMAMLSNDCIAIPEHWCL